MHTIRELSQYNWDVEYRRTTRSPRRSLSIGPTARTEYSTELDRGLGTAGNSPAEDINEQIEDTTVGGCLTPFYLIPLSFWHDNYCVFLIDELGLLPYDLWNVSFLPEDETTALVLESSPHPGNNIPEYTFQAEGLILQLCEEIRDTAVVSGRDDAVMEELRESCHNLVQIPFGPIDIEIPELLEPEAALLVDDGDLGRAAGLIVDHRVGQALVQFVPINADRVVWTV